MDDLYDAKEFFKLSYDASRLNTSFIDCLELQIDDIYGRKLVTNRDLKTGDVITVERPFFKSLDKNATDSRCLNCFKPLPVAEVHCRTCNSAKFCSEICRSTSWDEFHQFECQEFDKFTQDDGFMLMIQRTIFKSLKVYGGWENLQKALDGNLSGCTIFDFSMNENVKDNDRKRFISCWSLEAAPQTKDEEKIALSLVNNHSVIKTMCKTKDQKKSLQEFITKLIGIFNHNLFTLHWNHQESSAEETACGLFAFASFMNHSCAPNVFRVCFEDKVAFIACRPINAGNQLLMSYQCRFYQAPTIDRQMLLSKQFDFKCLCEACQNNFPLLNDLERLDPQFTEPVDHFESVAEAVTCWKMNCDYIDANRGMYPSYEIVRVMQNNHKIIRFIATFFD